MDNLFWYLTILRLYGLCNENIYKVIQKWKAILLQRGQVVQFTANLPDASKEQIEDTNDVCSICLQDMNELISVLSMSQPRRI
jgi:hypothetical protein